MGILDLLPPGLISLLTWLILFLAASALILILSIGIGRVLSDLVESLVGWIR
jgi:hypothetical protein